MKIRFLTLLTTLAFLGLCVSVPAFAGQGGEEPVVIFYDTDGSGLAQGSMKTARNSDNDVEYIGCKITRDDLGIFEPLSLCQALDASGDLSAHCNINNESIAASLNAMTSYSRIQFIWDASNICVRISISNNSFTLPETKLGKAK